LPRPAPTCPLCGGANGCAVARTGRFDEPCWCTSATFAPELIAALPVAAVGEACICARCAGACPPSPAR
jgi:hypothetical protein